MRMTSVLVGAAIAALAMSCLAFPASAASYDESIVLDDVVHAGADFLAPMAFEPSAMAIEVYDVAMVTDGDLAGVITGGGDEEEPASPSILATGCAFDLRSTNPRRYDPGWCS